MCACQNASAASTPGAGQLKVSCKVVWKSDANWSKSYTDSDGSHTMSIEANEQIGLQADLTFEYVDGAWELVQETASTSASGTGKYKISGKNSIDKSVKTILTDPTATTGYVSIRNLDMANGTAVVRFGKPDTTTDPECLECGFIAIAAIADCMSTIDTNQISSEPEEVGMTFTQTNKAFTATGTTNWSNSGGCGSSSVQATCTISYTPGQWEAVIITPSDFDSWLPIGNKDPDKPGNSISVNVQLRHKGEKEPTTDVVGTFYVTLENVSKQPGYCVNAPSENEAATDADLKLKEGDNLWLDDEASGYSEEEVSEQSITIESYDFGSYGRLRVKVDVSDGTSLTAHLENDPGKDYLDLPKDDNNNHIADAWEKDNGVEELPARWDEANQPAGQYTMGDGISLYEKYRGFLVKGYHQRLEPQKKHLFIYDPSGWALQTAVDPQGFSFIQALDCEVVFVDEKTWTGPGSSGSKKRIVNFNSTEDVHAVDQHALHLRFPFSNNPTEPADYQDQYKAKYGTNSTESLEGTFGCTYPDHNSFSDPSPKSWLVIEIYANNIEKFTRKVVTYHTYGLPELLNYTNLTVPKETRAAQLASEYIDGHRDDFEKRNWLHMTKTTTHEIGHGVGIDDLTIPRNVGPWECVMRYFGWDFPRTPTDRLELGLRNPWPHIYCKSDVGTVPGISCWQQIRISDRADAPRAPAAALAHIHGGIQQAAEPVRKAPVKTLVDEPPPLTLTSALPWDDLYAGDPLRVEFTVACSAYQQAALQAMQTGTNVPANLLHPTLATNWQDGLYISLYRYDGVSQWQEVISGQSWRNYLLPPASSSGDYGKKPLARSCEYLIPREDLKLAPGEYTLSAIWDGEGLVESEALDADSYISAASIRFMVLSPTNAQQQALLEHRWAYQCYLQGDFLGAWQHCQNALQIPAARERLIAEGTDQMALNASLKMTDYRKAVGLLQTMNYAGRREFGEYAAGMHKMLAPEIHLNADSARTGKAQLTVQALPGQNYEVQYSDNLATWTMLDQRLTQTNRYQVTDRQSVTGTLRYYRVVWLP